MNFIPFLLALVIGYLMGSISFTRILGRWLAPGEDLSVTEFKMSESSKPLTMKRVSATSLAFRKGPKAGCSVTILDMLKAAIPVFVFRYYFPNTDYYWLAAAGSVLGHNYPIYYNFKGGGGMSPLFGGLLIIDWIAVPAITLGGMVLGIFVFQDLMAAWLLGVPLLIPWMIIRHQTPISIAYSILVNVFFIAASYPSIKDYLELKRSGETPEAGIKQMFKEAKKVFMKNGNDAENS
jgi:glycerol-3-phosphate acyltransferase PlsY